MAPTWVNEWHWEGGQEHPDWVNSISSPPVVDEVSSTTPIGGDFMKRLVFAGNDNYGVTILAPDALTASSDTVCLIGQFRIAGLSEFDDIAFSTVNVGGFGTGHLGFFVNGSGGGGLGAATSLSTVDGALLAGGVFSNGTIQDGVTHRFCLIGSHQTSGGSASLWIDGALVASVSGLDTWGPSSSPGNNYGMSCYFSTATSITGSPEVWIDNITLGREFTTYQEVIVYEAALLPTGVTADDDGIEFGGAATAHEALDDLNNVSGDGITLGTVGHIQGLTYPSRAATGTIKNVRLWGIVGDSADGSEQLVTRLGDTTTETANFGPVALNSGFALQRLSDLLDAPPSGGTWDDTDLDAIYSEMERTA